MEVIERFFRTLKQECVWLHHFESFEEAERVILAWIDRYNTERQHPALGYLTPRAWRERFYQLPPGRISPVDFPGGTRLHAKLRAWEHEYNNLRPHLALKGKTPAGRLCELRISVYHPVRQTA